MAVTSHLELRTSNLTRECGEIGRHARLRIWCRKAWGFESLHSHSFFIDNPTVRLALSFTNGLIVKAFINQRKFLFCYAHSYQRKYQPAER